MVNLSSLFYFAAALPGLVLGYALPEACSGTCTNSHDPAIIRRADGTYFRFSTGGKIAIHTAPALTGPWTYRGAVLPSGSSIALAGNQDLWVRLLTSSELFLWCMWLLISLVWCRPPTSPT
jgi:arabinan endo-1,5-alpha-L-arabinosidase